MLLHAFPSMFVSSLREFPENCVCRYGGFNCFIIFAQKIINCKFSLLWYWKCLKSAFIGQTYGYERLISVEGSAYKTPTNLSSLEVDIFQTTINSWVEVTSLVSREASLDIVLSEFWPDICPWADITVALLVLTYGQNWRYYV
jgi:hypothetical protein